MEDPIVPTQYTATGSLVAASDNHAATIVVVLTAGAAGAARATINRDGAAGTAVLELAATSGTMSEPIKLSVPAPYLAAISGAGASLTVLK